MDANSAEMSDNENLDLLKYLTSRPAIGSAIGTSLMLGVTAAETIEKSIEIAS
jgi:hypothetical protein